jgi:hypothetical protein
MSSPLFMVLVILQGMEALRAAKDSLARLKTLEQLKKYFLNISGTTK